MSEYDRILITNFIAQIVAIVISIYFFIYLIILFCFIRFCVPIIFKLLVKIIKITFVVLREFLKFTVRSLVYFWNWQRQVFLPIVLELLVKIITITFVVLREFLKFTVRNLMYFWDWQRPTHWWRYFRRF